MNFKVQVEKIRFSKKLFLENPHSGYCYWSIVKLSLEDKSIVFPIKRNNKVGYYAILTKKVTKLAKMCNKTISNSTCTTIVNDITSRVKTAEAIKIKNHKDKNIVYKIASNKVRNDTLKDELEKIFKRFEDVKPELVAKFWKEFRNLEMVNKIHTI